LGNMFELDAIAAVVIGGTFIGALIIGVLNNGMSLLGVSSFYQLIIKGLIISLAVWCDVLQKRNWRAQAFAAKLVLNSASVSSRKSDAKTQQPCFSAILLLVDRNFHQRDPVRGRNLLC